VANSRISPGAKPRNSIERFDGGLNTLNSPAAIKPEESPDLKNCVFDEEGAVTTRSGTVKWNMTAIGSAPVDWGISYNTTMIAWSNGAMWRTSGPSGTTFTKITQTSGKFATGVRVAAIVYQNILFTSDGVNGPWKYDTSGGFYNMGIDIPSAPTGASNGAGSISTGSYYYGVSFVNSQVVEGEIGSMSVGVTTTGSSTIRVTQIPVGSSLAGVNQRFIYRGEAASGPFYKVGTINDNTTTTFDDTVANGAEGKAPVLDGTKPDAFKTIALHKERLFFDSSEDRTFGRWTPVGNPFIAPALNEEPFNQGDGEDIQAIASQDDFAIFFKKNRTFALHLTDPADDTTWQKIEIPGNIGIIGKKALVKIQNGLIFGGQQNNRFTGLHFLTGLRIIETSDGRLRSLAVSEQIEPTMLKETEPTQWANIQLELHQNRLFMAYAPFGVTTNNRVLWLDLNRLKNNNNPGSWSIWTGLPANFFFMHNGLFFFGDSSDTGFVRRVNAGSYDDDGVAIDSYFWTKQIGGQNDGGLDSWVKDLRNLYVWHAKVGNFNMNVRVRADGDSSDGTAYVVDLNQGSALWGSMIWGVDPWGGIRDDFETRIPTNFLGKRFQVRFDNQNVAGQYFKVHRLELEFNLRRRRQ
jgi:hypothetical protein